ncbi:MAG: hypothetical protein JSS27_12630 [Planctomycetes bacterium]|nr:hypothetical protein [Planctomycetota bacterium]
MQTELLSETSTGSLAAAGESILSRASNRQQPGDRTVVSDEVDANRSKTLEWIVIGLITLTGRH